MNDKWVVCIPICGLGNRLRFIASCNFFAEKFNRKLAILWKNINEYEPNEVIKYSTMIGISFENLFENDIPTFGIDNIKFGNKKICSNMQSYLIHGTIDNAYFKYKSGEFVNYTECSFINMFQPCDESISELKKYSDTKIIMFEGENMFLPSNDYLMKSELSISKTQFYKSLVPVKEIHDIINVNIPKIKDYICIHVRAYNKKYDPLSDIDDSWLDENSYGMIDNVINYYIKLNELFNYEQPRFLLLSNSSKIKEHFSEKYPSIITTYNNNNLSRNEEGIKCALIEWYLMANCKLIWGSHSSSFSTEACFLNKIQKRILRDISNYSKHELKENSICAHVAIDNLFDKIKNPENSREIIVINP
jgi:hypothetical protein